MDFPDVLVIEDDAAIRELIIEALTDEGYVVLGLAGGRAALTTAAAPRLILLDRHLGDSDGGEVLAALRRSCARPGAPVVLMSASSTVHTEAAELRADGALAKPFQLDALLACVGEFLGRPAARALGGGH